MESTDTDSLAACLLRWVKTFEGVGTVEGLQSLGDGTILWTILREIDADYFLGDLPEPRVTVASDWTRKWQNLRHVEKQVSTYYRDVCNGQEQMSADAVPDLKAVAAESSVAETEKLIMTIIRAAMASPESNQKMAQRLMSLGREHAMIIANELRSMEEVEYSESEPVSRDESVYHSEQDTPEPSKTNGTPAGKGIYQDPLLEREDELLRAQATIDKLEARHAEAQRQLQDLRYEKEKLQEAFDVYRSEIEIKGRKSAEDDAFKKLQRQTNNDRAYIDELETQLQSSRGNLENYERQMQRYKDENEANQKLRDEVQLLKADNEDLSQKIKANENLKKKIHSLQEQEKTSASLREDLKQANERLEGIDQLKQIQAGLEKEIIEKQGLIRNQEYQINELTTTRKHAEYDARVLAQKLQDARDRHDRDHEAIQELKSKLQDSSLAEPQNDEAPASTEGEKTPTEPQAKIVAPTGDDSKHLAEKVALLQQQLETADSRLKQTSERNALLEEQQRGNASESDARRAIEAQVQQHERTIANLRSELEAASKQKSEGPAPPQDLAALQRENRLMATAWYDLSSRLQNNGVSLGRRRQEPKSWIGKQRALVGPSAVPPR